eukprot:GHVT01061898.1.p1 GENE.GHVT01061898.1~~GHVT01061898.1.p1  ORF type:complete len:317 (+),score=43.41 GHVT01061898.1:198-1148(+)
MVTQTLALARRPHIIVASPGRLADHLEATRGFSLRSVAFLVLDEADRLLSLDFEEPLNKIIQAVPRERQTMLFSATMTTKVSKLQRACLSKPVKLEVSTKYDTSSNLLQKFVLCPFKFKMTYLVAVARHFASCRGIFFTNTCLGAQRLTVFLRHLSFSAVCLHGKMTQPQRLGALNQFKAGSRALLVATEVGSRGLDLPSVALVVNVDVPLSSKDYIHRVGRTARAGRTGTAITLVTQYDVEGFQRIEFALAKKLKPFDEFEEAEVMKNHERCLEALRSSELEIREGDMGALIFGKRKRQASGRGRGMGNRRGRAV